MTGTAGPLTRDGPRTGGVERGSIVTAEDGGSERRRRVLWRQRGRVPLAEQSLLFGLSFAAFAALGIWVTVNMEVVAFDSAFRALHAYAALYNDPPKLAAIGFVWPPLMTLTYLPFVAIKPLATSLVAIPVYSAVFAGGTLVALNRVLAFLEWRRLLRLALLVAFALNPLFVHYATNGMAEILVMFLTVLAIDQFIRWVHSGLIENLTLCAVATTACVLSRYEMAPFALALAAAVAAVAWRRRATGSDVEADLILFGAPVLYGVGAWIFFNWIVMGDPLHFLGREIEERFVLEGERSVAEGGSGGARPEGILHLLGAIVDVNWQVFAVTLLVVPALLVLAVKRRDLIALTLATLSLINPVTTAAAVMRSDLSLLQLRFNMRTMPIVLIGIGYLAYRARGRLRLASATAGIALVALSALVSWHAMRTYPYTFAERDFVAAVARGERTDPARVEVNQRIADYVNDHVSKPRSILVDDAQTFMPLLLGGRPDVFFDRTDRGDAVWELVADDPYGRVDWMLMPKRQGVIPDRVLERYPEAPSGENPLLRPRFEAGAWVLIRVLAEKPPKNGGESAEKDPQR